MMKKKTKRKIILISTVVLAVVGYVLFMQVIKPQLDGRMVTAVVPMVIENDGLSYGFTYPSGEQGYTLIEPPLPESPTDGLQQVFIIMDTQDYIKYQAPGNGAAAPAAVSVFVVELPELPEGVDRLAHLTTWAEANPQFSSYSRRTTEPESLTLDGVKAVRYHTDGAFRQTVHLATYQGNAYVFVGQYEDDTDAIRAMYDELITSVTFY
ncbi:hypothetical protein KC906_02380 [Candidatus Kaiserbacteria bacterium]|nr:hypothetical protein [Candidatus Kaiserbacteria bacterium]MCB9812210.1 hypothetical protein [Candidatus Nomurabacteria bacterium]